MKYTCELCGKERNKKNIKYCSYECAGIAKRTHDHNKVCEVCGENYISQDKKSRFCSLDCSSERRVVNHPKHTCFICGRVFRRAGYRLRGEITLCSQECNCAYMRYKRNKDIKEVKVSFTCQFCGKIHEAELMPHKARLFAKRKFCNTSCTNNYRYRKDE